MDAETQNKNISEPNREDVEKRHRPQVVNDSSENLREDEKITNDVDSEQPVTKNLENDDNSVSPDLQYPGNEVEDEQNQINQDSNGSPTNPNNEITSDEEYALLDKNQALDLFNKMTQESIQKILQSDSSESGDEAHITDIKQDIDKMINSDPQKLILLNGHASSDIDNSNDFRTQVHDGGSEEVEVPPIEGENQVEPEHYQKANEDFKEQAEVDQPAQQNQIRTEESKVESIENPTEEENQNLSASTPVSEENQPVGDNPELVNKDLEEVQNLEESKVIPENRNSNNDLPDQKHRESDAKKKKQPVDDEEEDEDYDPLLGSKNSKSKSNQYLDQLK